MMGFRIVFRVSILFCFLVLVLESRGEAIQFYGKQKLKPMNRASLTVDGSYGRIEKDFNQDYIEAWVSLDDGKNLFRYDSVYLVSMENTQTFSGTFSPGLGKDPVPVLTEITYVISRETMIPSKDLAYTARNGGGFRAEDFSKCGYGCYRSIIRGTWRIKGPETDTTGQILVIDEKGSGNARTGFIAKGFPDSIRLVDFDWGGSAYPKDKKEIYLVDAVVDNIPIKIGFNRMHLIGTIYRETFIELPMSRTSVKPAITVVSNDTLIGPGSSREIEMSWIAKAVFGKLVLEYSMDGGNTWKKGGDVNLFPAKPFRWALPNELDGKNPELIVRVRDSEGAISGSVKIKWTQSLSVDRSKASSLPLRRMERTFNAKGQKPSGSAGPVFRF